VFEEDLMVWGGSTLLLTLTSPQSFQAGITSRFHIYLGVRCTNKSFCFCQVRPDRKTGALQHDHVSVDQ